MARTGGTLVTFPISDTGLYVSFIANGGLYQRLRQKSGPRRVRWSRVEEIMQRYYAQMASELQAMVVEESQKSRERPNVSSGRMDAATLDERNRILDKGGFGVGVASFLDKSQAKYWRQIEEGFGGHVGRQVYGIFGATLTGRLRPGRRFPSWRNASAGPGWSFVGGSTGGSFMPKKALPAAVRREHFSGSREGARNTRMVINKAIEGQNAYGRAFARFRRGNRAFWLFRQVVMSELGLTSDQTPRSYQGILNDVF